MAWYHRRQLAGWLASDWTSVDTKQPGVTHAEAEQGNYTFPLYHAYPRSRSPEGGGRRCCTSRSKRTSHGATGRIDHNKDTQDTKAGRTPAARTCCPKSRMRSFSSLEITSIWFPPTSTTGMRTGGASLGRSGSLQAWGMDGGGGATCLLPASHKPHRLIIYHAIHYSLPFRDGASFLPRSSQLHAVHPPCSTYRLGNRSTKKAKYTRKRGTSHTPSATMQAGLLPKTNHTRIVQERDPLVFNAELQRCSRAGPLTCGGGRPPGGHPGSAS